LIIGWCYALENRGLSSVIYYAHEVFRGLFSWKDYAPDIPEYSFHKFSVSRKIRGQTAMCCIYFDPRIIVMGGGFYFVRVAMPELLLYLRSFCCRVTFAWKTISVSEFRPTTGYTVTYDITWALPEWKQRLKKVVLWSRGGAHPTKPGWSKPLTHSNST